MNSPVFESLCRHSCCIFGGWVPYPTSSTECSYCEVYKECRFFKGKNPSTLEIIEMWLNEEVSEDDEDLSII